MSRGPLLTDSALERHLILDGPTGTELLARGYPARPWLWTALAAWDAPALLRAVHQDYLAAGADILTANTFRTSAHALAQVGREAEARALTMATVAAARDAINSRGAPRPAAAAPSDRPHPRVAGSLAPLADCYHPERAPADAVLDRAHRHHAALLAEAGCDLLLVETQGSAREALAAVRAAQAETALPVWVSFLPAEEGARLLGGDPLLPTARACLGAGAAAVLVNCVHADVIDRALAALAPLAAEGVPLGAYGNAARMQLHAGAPIWLPDSRPLEIQARAYGRRAQAWRRDRGAYILGACCGATPAYIREVALALRGEPFATPGAAP